MTSSPRRHAGNPSNPRHHHRRPGTVLLGLLGTAALAVLPTSTASAHVRVTPDNPVSGSVSALTFRVPNESDAAGAVTIRVELPRDTPFLYVGTKPVPGWTATAAKTELAEPVESYGTTLTEAVSEVTWTADRGVQIGPGEYQEFSISVGPLPEPGQILLPTTQTYSDGTVVAWDQPSPASGEQPEHPAPAFTIAAAAPGSTTDGGESIPPADGHDPQTADAAPGGDPVARAIGGLGLVGGVGALAVAAAAWRRSGRRASA